MAKIQSVFFDLDGTLIDTEPAAERAIRDCFAQWGLPVTPDDAAYITGRTWASAFEYLFKRYNLPLPAEDASLQIQNQYRKNLETGLPIVPGAIDAVRDLAKEFQVALVSGSLRREILWALDRMGITQEFKLILGGDEYPRSKPAPDGYLKAYETLQAQPETTLIFEDSTAGVASALATGAWVVAVTGTHTHRQEISGTHFQIPHLQNVNRRWVQEIAEKHLKRKSSQA